MIEIPITAEMRGLAENYKHLQGEHNTATLDGGPQRDSVGTLGEIIVCQYLGLNVDEYFQQKVDMNWRWDFNLNIGHYDVKAMERKRRPLPFYMHDVTEDQKLASKADGYLFCDIRDPDHGAGWIVGYCTRDFFDSHATKHAAGTSMPTNPNYVYKHATYDIPISLLTDPGDIKIKEKLKEIPMPTETVVAPELIEQWKKEYAPLALRVRDGNDKLITAWKQIQDYEDLKIYEASLDKITRASEKLRFMCLKLEVIEETLDGKADCLYIMNKKKIRQCSCKEKTPKGKEVETWCWVCPSAHPYWREECLPPPQPMLMPKD